MAAVATNDPYQRVAKDNGVFDGAMIGAGIGAIGATAGVFGTRMSYNGIGKRVERDKQMLEGKLKHQQKQAQRAENKYNKVSQNAGPRFYEKNRYNRGMDAEERIVSHSNNLETAINNNRKLDVSSLQERTAADIEGTVNQVVEKNPHSSPNTVRRHNIDVQQRRNQYLQDQKELNANYDQRIGQVRQNTSTRLDQNKDVQRKSRIQNKIDGRVNQAYTKYTDKVNNAVNTASQLRDIESGAHAEHLRKNHAYSRHMGGWKNAAIIGASAVIGSGAGMLTDSLYQQGGK